MQQNSYQIRLPQFEGPFDLLLFFIERDELDIYNIPITRITNDFLDYIHQQEELNVELSSEFILFISTLMRIKAKMLLPRKELDEQGNEIDPRAELVNKILEYKRFKEASAQMAEMEAQRLLLVKRGNIQRELSAIGEEASEGTEITQVTLFKLMKLLKKPCRSIVIVLINLFTPLYDIITRWRTAESKCFQLPVLKKHYPSKRYLRPAKTGFMPFFFSCLCWS